MKYAIISDIHANESALRQVLADARAEGAEKVICLGDVVGYGPFPRETVALVRQSATATLAGNHDDAVSGRRNADDFAELAEEAVRRHRKALTADERGWLRSLPHVGKVDDALAAHGDFTEPGEFRYVEDERDAEANFKATDAQLMFVGHTHVPAIFLTGPSGRVYRLEAQDFVLENGKRYIVNPGSVGYPRETNGVCLSTYVIYDTDARAVYFRRLPFSVASVMQRDEPSRGRGRGVVLALLAFVLAAALGVIALLRTSAPEAASAPVVAATNEVRSLVIAERQLTVGSSAGFVRANLKIDGKCAPVTLHVVFRSSTGESLSVYEKTVKRSSRDRIKIPAGTISAHFSIRKQVWEDSPRILSFAPSASAK